MTDNRLLDIIIEEIRKSGPIPFSRYMELCLYHPWFGYYQRGVTVTGRDGDFFTAPHVHSLFGTVIARWILSRIKQLKADGPALIELGPGNGRLMQDILNDWKSSGNDSACRVELVEGSPHQREALLKQFHDHPVRIRNPENWESMDPFHGVVLANEFFDALPLRVIAREGGELQEVFVDFLEGKMVEILRPLDVKPMEGALLMPLDYLPDGQRMEFSDAWRIWLRRISGKLRGGTVLVIDYGDVTEALNVPWRGAGTLRCYRKHSVDGDPYSFPGEKDITAHVNFSLLEGWAMEEGFTRESFTTQSSFLTRAGLLELLIERMEGCEGDTGAMQEWLTVKNLIQDEGGMGETFKVMVLVK